MNKDIPELKGSPVLSMKEYAVLATSNLISLDDNNKVSMKGCNEYEANALRSLGVREIVIQYLVDKYNEGNVKKNEVE